MLNGLVSKVMWHFLFLSHQQTAPAPKNDDKEMFSFGRKTLNGEPIEGMEAHFYNPILYVIDVWPENWRKNNDW